MGSPIVHIEIPAMDPLKAKEFYSKVFGWKVYEKLGFMLFETAPPSVGGNFTKVNKIEGDSITFYIAVDDIDRKLEEIIKAGGRVIKKKKKIAKVGWQATFTDVFGNTLLLFTPLKQPTRVQTQGTDQE